MADVAERGDAQQAAVAEPAAAAARAAGGGRHRMLLYIGAGWDALMVGPLAQRHGYTLFVFVDTLPALQCYPPGSNGWRNSRDVDSLLTAVRRRLQHLGCAVTEEGAAAERRHTFLCTGAVTARLDYFYSTPDTAMQDNPALARLLPEACGLLLCGHTPPPAVLNHLVLPGVAEVFASDVCWRQMGGGTALPRAALAALLKSEPYDDLDYNSAFDFRADDIYFDDTSAALAKALPGLFGGTLGGAEP